MDPAKSFKFLLQAELRLSYPRVEILAPLYEQVAELMVEEEGWTGLFIARAGC